MEAVVDVQAFAEVVPSAPCPVATFVGIFLDRIQDDSAVRIASETKEEISLGSGEIAKFSGIS